MPSLRVLSVVVLIGMGAGVAAVSGYSTNGLPGSSGLTASMARPASAAMASTSFDVRAENRLPGTRGWRIVRAAGTQPGLAAYAGSLSVRPGQAVALTISGQDGARGASGAGAVAGPEPVRVRVLRIGWYGGVGARQISKASLRTQPQPANPGHWLVRARFDTTGWPPGHYLLRLDHAAASRYVPLTIRSLNSRGRILVLTSPLTWQAENGQSAAGNQVAGNQVVSNTAATGDRMVSFDRPYVAGYGSGGFLSNDAAIVQLAERTGKRLAYATDYDVVTDPGLVSKAAAVLTGGDSQYWTTSLRIAIRRAGDAGTNLAFFGAGTGSRLVRLRTPGRLLQISAAEPSTSVQLTGVRPSCPTASSGPDPTVSAGSSTGSSWTVSNSSWWGYQGTGVRTGQTLPGLVARTADRASTSSSESPKPLQVLSFTRLSCGQVASAQSGVYLVRPSQAGVFTAATGRWACAAADTCVDQNGQPVPVDSLTRRFVIQVTRKVIDVFAKARAGGQHPAKDTASQYTALR